MSLEKSHKEYSLTVKNLSVYFDKHLALENVSLSVKDKSISSIIGPSGCGKSTLLRALNFMHELTPKAKVLGEIEIFEEKISNFDAVYLRSKVGMVFQKPNPFPTMSIYENVISGLILGKHKRLKRIQYEEIVEKSLINAGLWVEVKDRLKDSAMSISGGQQQRLCIARTLAVNPDIILMDEPTSALDPKSTSIIEELMHNLRKNYTILIVTHNMQQAARISDHTAFLYLGKLIEYSSTSNIFTNPKEKLTEQYITGKFG
jgi:phosphate transport system ATP-binding protein